MSIVILFLLPDVEATTVSSGKIVLLEPLPSKYIKNRRVQVWLPDGYSIKQKYNVLYMHDGQMLFDASTTWNNQEWGVDEVAGELISNQKTKPFIIVAIDNSPDARHSEYFPQKVMQSLVNNKPLELFKLYKNKKQAIKATTVFSDRYLWFLVNELKPYIDSHFSVLTEAENTFIMGSSMGGLISIYAISEYPEIFGGAACLSTHWPGVGRGDQNPIPQALFEYLEAYLPSPKNHKFYFDYGNQTLDSLYPPLQKKVDEIMQAKGYREQSWITRFYDGADHSEKSWRKRLHVPLIFLLGKKK